jgi:hypothetical protein
MRYSFGERTNVFPLVREMPRTVVPQPLVEYHVQVPGCARVAGTVVKDKKVKLTKEAAQYWLDQGVLAAKAGDHRAGAALGVKPKGAVKR